MENNIDFLAEVLSVQTKSKQEKQMKKYIRTYIRSLGLTPSNDNKGNIYCHKGDMRKNRPFVVAHMDTVHDVNKNIKVFNSDGMLFAFDTKDGSQKGIGGDDKVGVWSALSALTDFDDISVAFFVEEEIGRHGSGEANMKMFKKANWIVQLDRKGNDDFIVSNMTSNEFNACSRDIVESRGFKFTEQATITDVSELASRGVGVSCVNVSSGYYNPHTSREFVIIDDAINSLGLLYDMINKFGDLQFKHEIPAPPPRKLFEYKGSKAKSMVTHGNKQYSDKWGLNASRRVFDSFLKTYSVYFRGSFSYYEDKNGEYISRDEYNEIKKNAYERKPHELPVADCVDDCESMDEYYDSLYGDYEDKEPVDGFSSNHLAYNDVVVIIETALRLFGYSYQDYLLGDVPDDYLKNVSVYIVREEGHPLSYYEKIIGLESSVSTKYTGAYVKC